MADSVPHPGGGLGSTRSAVVDTLRAAGCVFAEQEASILIEASAGSGRLSDLVARRVAGEPLEYIVGWVDFAGLRVGLDPGVFVPRRRSELLVREGVAAVRARAEPVVVDVCCGCGAIGLAVASAVPGTRLYAADIDPAAAQCAERNLAAVGGRVFVGDLFDALPAALHGRVEVLTANAPYVPTAAIPLMPPEARDHEPAVALDGGSDGTDVLRRVIAGAPAWLAPGGVLLVEVATSQVAGIREAMNAVGLRPSVVTDDELGATAALGRRTHPD